MLDARDPIGTRLLPLERSLLAKGKKMLLVLDNADMVPAPVLEAWLVELNSEHPTFMLASATAKSSLLYALRNASVDMLLRLLDAHMNSAVTASSSASVPTAVVVAYRQIDADRTIEQLAGKFVHVAKSANESSAEMLDEMPDAKIRLLSTTANSLDCPEESVLQLLQAR